MRLLGLHDPDIEYSDSQRATVVILKNVLYSHKTVRVNYTTYDGRLAQDCLSARKQSDVMVLSREDSLNRSPYWYARIIRIFRIKVLHTGSLASSNKAQTLDVIWVRWFGADPGSRSGFKVTMTVCISFK